MESTVPLLDLHLHQERSARLNQVLAARHLEDQADWSTWRTHLESTRAGMDRLRVLWDSTPTPYDADVGEVTVARLIAPLSEAAAAGAILAEIRVGNDTVVRQRFVEYFLEALTTVQASYPYFRVSLIVTMKLWFGLRELRWTLDRCLDTGHAVVSGLDFLYEPYDAQADLSVARVLADRAVSAGLGVTAHGGEFSKHNIAALLTLPGITRIGHAAYVCEDSELLDLLVKSGVAVECCLTSNLVLGAVSALVSHPITRFYEIGVPIVLGTDNPLRFGTTIAKEYAHAASLGMSQADLLGISRTAVERAFVPDSVRDHLLALPIWTLASL